MKLKVRVGGFVQVVVCGIRSVEVECARMVIFPCGLNAGSGMMVLEGRKGTG